MAGCWCDMLLSDFVNPRMRRFMDELAEVEAPATASARL
jgi:hypothetical protein